MVITNDKLRLASTLAIWAIIAQSVESQVLLPGSCPVYPTQTRFNPGAFIAGSWYEALRYPSPFEESSRCSSIDIRPSSAGYLRFTFKGVNRNDQSLINVAGKGYFAQGELSKLYLNVPIASWNRTSVGVHFWVLATDYQNYAVAWSCDDLCDGLHREQAWVLSRQRTMPDSTLAEIYNKFVVNGPLKQESLITVDQKQCDAPLFVKLALGDLNDISSEKK